MKNFYIWKYIWNNSEQKKQDIKLNVFIDYNVIKCIKVFL